MMERKKVISSNIKSIGYDKDNLILEVAFINGGIYQYYNVPEYEFTGIMSADSHGVYLNQNVKGVYDYKEIK